MKRRVGLALRVVVLSLALGLVCGCVTEPVAGEPGEIIDLTPFVGTWTDETYSEAVVDFSIAGENTLHGAVRDVYTSEPSASTHITASLTTLNEQLVASVEVGKDIVPYGEPLWFVGEVEIENDGTQLIITGLDAADLERALDTGEVEAQEPSETDQDDPYRGQFFRLSGADLREYLATSPGAFDEAQQIVLSRGEPGESRQEARRSRVSPAYPYPGYPEPGRRAPTQPPYDRATAVPGPLNPSITIGGIPVTATPSGGPVTTGNAGEPLPVSRLVGALAIVLLTGLIAVLAVDYVRRRAHAHPEAVGAPATDGAAGYDGAVPGDGDGTPSLRGTVARYMWPAILVFAVAAGPILFLTVLLRGLSLPEWMAGVQPGTQQTLRDFAPYVLVFSFGAMIGVAEVVNAFSRFSWEALSTKWATLLVLVNGLGTMIVYAVASAYGWGFDHPLLRALAIAAGFAILIRTRFVLARDLLGNGISLDFGWLYARFQELCRQQIEADLVRDRRFATHRLLELYPDTDSLKPLAAHVISQHASPAADELQTRLDAILEDDLPTGLVRARVARFIVEAGGPVLIGFLIDHSSYAESHETDEG